MWIGPLRFPSDGSIPVSTPSDDPLDDDVTSRRCVQVNGVGSCSATSARGAPKAHVFDMSVAWNAVLDQVGGEEVRVVMAGLAYDADRHSTTRGFLEIRYCSHHPAMRTNKEQMCNACARSILRLRIAGSGPPAKLTKMDRGGSQTSKSSALRAKKGESR